MFSFSLKLARLDSVGDHDTGFPAGSRSASFQSANLATKQWTAATEIRLLDGHNGTRRTAIMAVEPAFLSLQRPSGTAQVSGTMDPPKEGTKLLGDHRGEEGLLGTGTIDMLCRSDADALTQDPK